MTIFSSSFQNWRNFSFSSQSLSKANPFLFSKVHNILFDFYFSSRNWENWLQISRSPFKIGEIVFKSLFLFSWLFCLSLTTAVAHSSVISLLKHLKWANNFNAKREKTLSNSHTLPHCHTAILSKLQGYSHNEWSSCNNRHQKMNLPPPQNVMVSLAESCVLYPPYLSITFLMW